MRLASNVVRFLAVAWILIAAADSFGVPVTPLVAGLGAWRPCGSSARGDPWNPREAAGLRRQTRFSGGPQPRWGFVTASRIADGRITAGHREGVDQEPLAVLLGGTLVGSQEDRRDLHLHAILRRIPEPHAR